MKLEELIGKKVLRKEPVSGSRIDPEEVFRFLKPDDFITVVGKAYNKFVVVENHNPHAVTFLSPYYYDDKWFDISECLNKVEESKNKEKYNTNIDQLTIIIGNIIDENNNIIEKNHEAIIMLEENNDKLRSLIGKLRWIKS